jgi:NTP pyrophosphatase (non-canonical NTP hydrolase)
MNIAHIQFELGEAALHLQLLLQALREERLGSGDDPELAAKLGHVLDHICFAWNGRDLSMDELGALRQEKFERLCNTVPNFLATRTLGEVAC